MKKNIIKTILSLIFLFYITLTSAFNAELSINENETDINDYIKVRLTVESSTGGEIQIGEVIGIDKFEIINQSQSQGRSKSVVIINGEQQIETTTSHNIDFTLKAKTKGEYKIGPIILQSETKKVETNSVNITVTGERLFVNDNHLDISKVKPKTKENKKILKEEISIKESNNIEEFNNIEKKEFSDNNKYYLLLLLIILTTTGFTISKYKNKQNLPFPKGVPEEGGIRASGTNNKEEGGIRTTGTNSFKENKEEGAIKINGTNTQKQKTPEELELYYSKYKRK